MCANWAKACHSVFPLSRNSNSKYILKCRFFFFFFFVIWKCNIFLALSHKLFLLVLSKAQSFEYLTLGLREAMVWNSPGLLSAATECLTIHHVWCVTHRAQEIARSHSSSSISMRYVIMHKVWWEKKQTWMLLITADNVWNSVKSGLYVPLV